MPDTPDPAATAAPRQVELLVVGGTVITVDEQRRILRDGAIAVDGGRIVAVGPTAEVTAAHAGRRTIDARGKVVTPGLVDAHVHLSHQLHRSILPDTRPEELEHDHWLPYWLNLTEADARLSALLACAEMALNGTTLFCDMSGRFTGELQAEAARAVGVRGTVSEICWDVPPHPEVAIGGTQACLDRLASLIERLPFSEDATTWAGVTLSGMGKATDDLLVGAIALAREHGLQMHMHQSFADADTAEFGRRCDGLPAVAHLERLGVTGPDLTLVHMIRTDPREVPILAATGTNVVHCPGASARWGLGSSRTGMVPQMLDAGVNLALGCDSANYSDALDLTQQMYLAATMHREARGGTPHVSAEQALEMATLGGATALGVGHLAGSLAVGRWADLVIHDGSRTEWQPGFDPVTTFVYSARSRGIETVVVGGEVVVAEGRLTRLDIDALLRDVQGAARGLLDRMGYAVEPRWLTV